jgi:LmbE family N-acetylglucosaminyl deacetylase
VNHVYLAPHLDDAALSCGGTIHARRAKGEPVLVITLLAGQFAGRELSPLAAHIHAECGMLPQMVTTRRAEDLAALSLLDAQVLHLDFLDAIYRTAPEGRWLYGQLVDLFGAPDPADPLTGQGVKKVAEQLAGLLPPPGQATLYAPLAVGRHVDHQIIHAVAQRLAAGGQRLVFYEDYPYAEAPGATAAALEAAGAGDWPVEIVPLDAADLAAKVSALAYYRSQFASLFGSAEAMPSRVWAFAATRAPQVPLAERLWWPAGA